MASSKYTAASLLLHAAAGLAAPAPAPAPAPQTSSVQEPETFTANTNVGPGGSVFTDSARFRIYGTDSADSALQMLEAAYTCFVTDLGWRSSGLSYNNDNDDADVWYKENIYSVSDLAGAAGVMHSDYATGLSWLEVVNSYLADPQVTVHEYGHALTYHARNWVDQTATGAWWETVANWVADTYATTDVCASARTQYSQPTGDTQIDLPKVIGDSFQVIVDGSVDTGNYYQAWPFLTFLTSNPDNYTGLGVDTVWELFAQYEIGSNETPLHTLARVSSSASVAELVGRYWARMAYVDIGHPAAQQVFLNTRSTLSYDNLQGSGGSYTVQPARQPQYMGANINPLTTSGGDITVSVQSNGEFTATLAIRDTQAGSVRYVDLANGSGSATLSGDEEASLVVAHTPTTLIQYDPFSLSADVKAGLDYSVQLTGATI